MRFAVCAVCALRSARAGLHDGRLSRRGDERDHGRGTLVVVHARNDAWRGRMALVTTASHRRHCHAPPLRRESWPKIGCVVPVAGGGVVSPDPHLTSSCVHAAGGTGGGAGTPGVALSNGWARVAAALRFSRRPSEGADPRAPREGSGRVPRSGGGSASLVVVAAARDSTDARARRRPPRRPNSLLLPLRLVLFVPLLPTRRFVGALCWPSVHAAGAFCSGLWPAPPEIRGTITSAGGPVTCAILTRPLSGGCHVYSRQPVKICAIFVPGQT